jgi:uncharacterized membrane protein
LYLIHIFIVVLVPFLTGEVGLWSTHLVDQSYIEGKTRSQSYHFVILFVACLAKKFTDQNLEVTKNTLQKQEENSKP